MKAKELQELTVDEMRVKLDEAHRELFNLRFQVASRQLSNTCRLAQVRRDIARLKTVMRERELEAARA